MYTSLALTTLAATLTAAAPAGGPQTPPVTLCNPAAILSGPFNLAAYNPANNVTAGLTIGVVSRGAQIIWSTADGSFEGATLFSYDSTNKRLTIPGTAPGSAIPSDNQVNPIVFGSAPGGGVGTIEEKVSSGCFHEGATPMFITAGEGGNAANSWAGWEFCASQGIGWTGDAPAREGCFKVGVQIYNADYGS